MRAICGLIFTAMALCLLQACSGTASGSTGTATAVLEPQPDSLLREFINTERKHGTLIGHQDDLAYGTVWFGEAGRSDVKEVCGDYPAVFGWDISGIERNTGFNVDSVGIDYIRKSVMKVAEIGCVSSIRWSIYSYSDDIKKEALDSVASFLSSLKDSNGKPIPVIFQPVFNNQASVERLRRLWKSVHSAISKRTDNVLYAYSVTAPLSSADFEQCYPGDKFVDIIGMELLANDDGSENYEKNFATGINALTEFAKLHDKIPAVTAAGIKGIKTPDFFTSCMKPAIAGKQIGYIMFWKNSWNDEGSYFIPPKGHPAADDFRKFVESDIAVMCSDISSK